ncbi:hypothetical protein B0H17DRAFT_160760 [Mycena rosella]|uniref:Uncharacterized protein n=1 Tax=Mycena rosella TaxID=1033263 RepID=A0AAD7D2T2_MYCRO|nr:hypothetical protein B0H17DRAFT_160760 [Mycena rosella]
MLHPPRSSSPALRRTYVIRYAEGSSIGRTRQYLTPEMALFYVKALEAHNRDSLQTFINHNPMEKHAVNEFLGLNRTSSIHSPITKEIKNYVGPAPLPVITFDTLLQAFDPEHTTPTIPRAPVRPGGTSKISDHLRQHSSWSELLQDIHREHLAYLAELEKPKATSRAPLDAKSRYLAFFSGTKYTSPGWRSLGNIWRAAFLLGLHLTGDFSLSKESIVRYVISDAAREGIALTADEVSSHLPAHDISPALFIALAHSPLLLPRDSSAYNTKIWTSPVIYIELWHSAGNEHRNTPGHPLGAIERLLWRLIFQAATHALTPHDVLVQFFKDPAVQSALSRPCDAVHMNALAYIDDPHPPKGLGSARGRPPSSRKERAAASRPLPSHQGPAPRIESRLNMIQEEPRPSPNSSNSLAPTSASGAEDTRQPPPISGIPLAPATIVRETAPTVTFLCSRITALERELVSAVALQGTQSARIFNLGAALEKETQAGHRANAASTALHADLQRDVNTLRNELRAVHTLRDRDRAARCVAEDALRAERQRYDSDIRLAAAGREAQLERPGAELDGRELLLATRETQLDERAEKLERAEDMLIRLAGRETHLDRRDAELDGRELLLATREMQLDKRAEKLERAEDMLIRLAGREAHLDRRDAELDGRELLLATRETQLDERAEKLERKEDRLRRERESLTAHLMNTMEAIRGMGQTLPAAVSEANPNITASSPRHPLDAPACSRPSKRMRVDETADALLTHTPISPTDGGGPVGLTLHYAYAPGSQVTPSDLPRSWAGAANAERTPATIPSSIANPSPSSEPRTRVLPDTHPSPLFTELASDEEDVKMLLLDFPE